MPKIFIERIPPRTSVREPQLAEQLVEVPTIVSFSSLQRIMEQTVDIPVPLGDTQIFKVFSEDRVQQVSSRSLIFPVEVFIAQDRVHLLQMGLVKGFFALFPKVASHSGSDLLPESSPSTRAAQLEDSVKWVRLRDDNSGKPYYWNRRTRASAWKPPPSVKVVWIGERNEEGVVWYWHRNTRVSTFDLPPLPPG